MDLWEPLPNKSGKLSQDLRNHPEIPINRNPKKIINKSGSVEFDGSLQVVHIEVYMFTFCDVLHML